MIDVLLTHSNHLLHDRKQVQKMQPYPPLQTLLAAACLRCKGYSVALFDSTLEDPEAGFERALAQHKPRLVAVIEDNFNFLTKMCLLRNRELACWFAATASRAGVPAVVNGADATDHVAEYLAAGFACVLRGEVEETLEEIAGVFLEGCGKTPLCGPFAGETACATTQDQQFASGGGAGIQPLLEGAGSLADTRGIAYLTDSGRVRQTAPRAPIACLDELPMPAWDLLDAEPYRRAWQSAHGYFSLNMVSSRGCPYRCNWCAKPIWSDQYRSRAPHLVAAEMLEVKQRFRPDHLWFADDIFALSPQWTREFTLEVQALGAQIPFKMQSRCDLMTRPTVENLAHAGCTEVWMGVESGSQEVLDAMDKGTRLWQIPEARENLRRHGVRACYFLQFGYPGEAWPEIEKTIAMVRATAPDDIGISVSYPLPGTPFHRAIASQLGPKENWDESGDLDMMFQGAFTSEFYRALADALHAEVRHGRAAADEAWAGVLALKETSARKAPLWISC